MRNDALHGGSPLAAHGPGWLAPTIQKAHERSEIFGLHTTTRPDYDVLPSPELNLKIEQSRALYAHALPVMETLREQIANTQSMIVLTDA
jgi:transcriptional regulator of acetoin/glycerol metabolism